MLKLNSKLLAILLSVLLVSLMGCSEKAPTPAEDRVIARSGFICEDDSIKARSEFILQCLNNANPKSDEEPEDWIPICERMSKDLHCKAGVLLIEQHKFEGDYIWHDKPLIKAN